MTGIKIKVRSDSTQARADLGRLENSVKNIEASANRVSSAFKAITVGASVLYSVNKLSKAFINAGDSARELRSRIKLVTGEGEQLNIAMDRLSRIARNTRVPMDTTANTFNRFGLALKGTKVQAQDLYRVTELVNKTLTISGTSGASAQAALVQFGQGLASGTLRGEELNSVLEQAPRLAQAIADGMDLPLGKLREVAKDGKITTEQILQALLGQGYLIDQEFKLIEKTVKSVSYALNSQFTKALGKIDGTLGFSSRVIKTIENITDYLSRFNDEYSLTIAGIRLEAVILAGNLEKAFLGISDILLSAFNVDVSQVGRILKSKIEEITSLINIPTIELDPSKLLSKLNKELKAVKDSGVLGPNSKAPGFRDIVDDSSFVSAITNLQSIANKIQSILVSIAGFFDDLYMSVVGNTSWLDTFTNAGSVGDEAHLAKFKEVRDKIEGVIDTIITFFSKLKSGAIDKWEALKSSLSQAKPVEDLSNLLTSMNDSSKGLITNLTDLSELDFNFVPSLKGVSKELDKLKSSGFLNNFGLSFDEGVVRNLGDGIRKFVRDYFGYTALITEAPGLQYEEYTPGKIQIAFQTGLVKAFDNAVLIGVATFIGAFAYKFPEAFKGTLSLIGLGLGLAFIQAIPKLLPIGLILASITLLPNFLDEPEEQAKVKAAAKKITTFLKDSLIGDGEVGAGLLEVLLKTFESVGAGVAEAFGFNLTSSLNAVVGGLILGTAVNRKFVPNLVKILIGDNGDALSKGLQKAFRKGLAAVALSFTGEAIAEGLGFAGVGENIANAIGDTLESALLLSFGKLGNKAKGGLFAIDLAGNVIDAAGYGNDFTDAIGDGVNAAITAGFFTKNPWIALGAGLAVAITSGLSKMFGIELPTTIDDFLALWDRLKDPAVWQGIGDAINTAISSSLSAIDSGVKAVVDTVSRLKETVKLAFGISSAQTYDELTTKPIALTDQGLLNARELQVNKASDVISEKTKELEEAKARYDNFARKLGEDSSATQIAKATLNNIQAELDGAIAARGFLILETARIGRKITQQQIQEERQKEEGKAQVKRQQALLENTRSLAETLSGNNADFEALFNLPAEIKYALEDSDVRANSGRPQDLLRFKTEADYSNAGVTNDLLDLTRQYTLINNAFVAGRIDLKTFREDLEGLGDKLPTVKINSAAKGAGELSAALQTLTVNLIKLRGLSEAPIENYDTKGRAFASGGYISGPGGPTEDKIPAMLSNGEYVIRAASVKKFGTGFLDKLNRGRIGTFANGTGGDPFEPVGMSYSGTITRPNTKPNVEALRELQTANKALDALDKSLNDKLARAAEAGKLDTAATQNYIKEWQSRKAQEEARAESALKSAQTSTGYLGEIAKGKGKGKGGKADPYKLTKDETEFARGQAIGFVDDLKVGFADALKSGDVEEFFKGILDSFTGRIVDTFAEGLINNLMSGLLGKEGDGPLGKLFEGVFSFGKRIGVDTQKQVADGLNSSAGEGASGFSQVISSLFGKDGLFSGLFKSIFGKGGFLSSIFSLFGGGASVGASHAGGVIQKRISGGLINPMIGQAGKDSVPVMLTPGEYVLPSQRSAEIFKNQKNSSQQTVVNLNVTGDISTQTKKEIMRMIPQIASGVNTVNRERT